MKERQIERERERKSESERNKENACENEREKGKVKESELKFVQMRKKELNAKAEDAIFFSCIFCLSPFSIIKSCLGFCCEPYYTRLQFSSCCTVSLNH